MSVRRVATAVAASALVVLAGVAAGRAADPPASRITVEFVDPQRFTDVKDSSSRSEQGTAALLDEIARFVRETGEQDVPAGRALDVRVTDIDMAGEFEPWRGPQFERIRFMREIYWPRIDLTFRLVDGQGRVVAEGRRSLTDQNYLTRALLVRDDRLRYEKAMLRDWLREFAA